MGERGKDTQKEEVAPLAGAWIEISVGIENASPLLVAPLAGAWIEMPMVR